MYGAAAKARPEDAQWAELSGLSAPLSSARQVYTIAVDLVRTCGGVAVPDLNLMSDCEDLSKHAVAKSPKPLAAEHAGKNTLSINGKSTG